MKTREISDGPATSALSSKREHAIATTAPASAGSLPLFLSKQTHSSGPQPNRCATTLSATDRDTQARRIHPQPHAVTPHPQQGPVSPKRSRHAGAQPTPATQFPSCVSEQTHCGVPQPAPNAAVWQESDLETPLRRTQPQPSSTAQSQPPNPIEAKRSHSKGTQSATMAESSTAFAAPFLCSVREQSQCAPGRSTPNPTKPDVTEPHSSPSQRQNPPAMAEQTHSAPTRESAATPSTARLAARFPSAVRDQTQSSEPRRRAP